MADWLCRARVEVFASTHTGLPFAQDYALPEGRCLVINNGRAGLPNFTATTTGVLARLSAEPNPPADSLYGTTLDGLRADAAPLAYDIDRWERRFLTQWPPGSAAHTAYYQLLRRGGPTTVQQAARGTLAPTATPRQR